MTGTFDPETKMMTLTFDEYKGLVADLGESQAEVKRLKHEYRHHPQVNRCPTCRSDNIGITEYHIHGGECHEVECSDCESIWWEAWKFMGIEMQEGEDNR